MQFAEGIVTTINQNLMFYEINEVIRVYTVFTYSEENPFHLLPNLGASITINPALVKKNHLQLKRHLKFKKRFIILNEKDIVECSSSNLIPIYNSRLYHVMKRTPFCTSKRSICARDVETINKLYDLMLAYSEGSVPFNAESILFQILLAVQRKYSQDKPIFHTLHLNFLNEINFIHESSNYIDKSWNYATCTKGSLLEDDYLFSYFYVDQKTGMPFLTDGKVNISCTAHTENGSRNLFEYINKFHLIKEWTVIYEYYKEKDSDVVTTSDHILFKLRSVICVRVGPYRCPELRNISDNIRLGFNCSNVIDIKIEGISLPFLNEKKELEVWLQIKHDSQIKFLRLEADFYNIFPLLRPHCFYRVHLTRQLFKAYHVEIYKLNTKAYRLGLPTKSVFELIPQNNSNVKYQDLESAEQCLKNSKQGEMVTFQGKLTKKSFVKPLSIPVQGKAHSFGTPGSQIHVLEFKTKTGCFKLYLYDWETRPTPHCLIPNMVLIVHNVLVQNGRYFKSCYMTMFEVVAYEPLVAFQSSNIFLENEYNYRYGANSILSRCQNPYNVIISSKVNIRQFFNVTITPASNPTSVRAEFKLLVIDVTGSAVIVVHEDYGSTLLKRLIKLSDQQYLQFCKEFVKFGQFTYPKYKQNKHHVMLAMHFTVLEQKKQSFDVKCIKLSEDGPTTYKLLEGQI